MSDETIGRASAPVPEEEPVVEAATEGEQLSEDAAPELAATDTATGVAAENPNESGIEDVAAVDGAAEQVEDSEPSVGQQLAATDAEAEAAADGTAEPVPDSDPGQPEEEQMVSETIFAEDYVNEHVGGDDSDRSEMKAVIEAVIYITDEPLTAQQIASALDRPLEEVKRVLAELSEEYARPERGLTIREIAGGYKLATKPEHHEAVRTFVKNLKPPLKLSLAALETLAVIAYKQPVTGPEIMEIRGVQGLGVLKTLIDRKLIATAGRKNVVGKPILYKTTKEFLVQFGLKDLAELPTLKEFEELGRLALSEGEPEQSVAPTPPDTATLTEESPTEAPPIGEPPSEPAPEQEPPHEEPPLQEPPSEEPPAQDPPPSEDAQEENKMENSESAAEHNA